jgi:RNA polymerase sigma factor (sigma-70 family)
VVNCCTNSAARDLQTLFEAGSLGGLSDGQLLDRFVARREGAVFEAILRRHGPMVLGVCLRVLRDHHDAEDACQASFLVLARKASTVMPREMLGNWLYGVAYQTAMKARSVRAKRRVRESQVPDMPEPVMVPHDLRDALSDCLDRELSRLPEKYRIPIVMCDLEGRGHKEAASRLGWPIGTVSSRLSRARTLLARRLSRQGVSLSAGSLAALLAQDMASASMPTQLIGSTVQAASLFAAGGAVTAGVVSADVAALIGEVLKVMLLGKLKVATAVLLVASVVVVGGTGLTYRARATEPTIPYASPAGQPIQEARPVDATAQEPRPKEQPFQEARPIAPARPKENTRAKSDDQPARDSTTTIPKQPRSSSVSPSDDPPLALPESGPTGPGVPLLPEDPAPTKGQDRLAEDPLADQLVNGLHTPKQLERAKAMIEAMLALEKEADSKSPQELTEMINQVTYGLEDARWQIRVLNAQLRRLTKIKEAAEVGTKRPGLAPVDQAPTGKPPVSGGPAPAGEGSTPVRPGSKRTS